MTTISVTDAQTTGTDTAAPSIVLSIGAGDGTRRISVGVWGRRSVTGGALSSLTVDGITVTPETTKSQDAGGIRSSVAAIGSIMMSALPSPTATSVTVVATYDGTTERSGAAVAVIPNGAAVLVHDTASGGQDGGGGGTATADLDIDVAPGGSVFAFAGAGVGTASTASYAPTGVTEDFDVQSAAENGRMFAGHLSNGSAETNRDVAIVGGGTGTWSDLAGVAVSYRDAAAGAGLTQSTKLHRRRLVS